MPTRTHRISALLFLLACLTPLQALADEWIEIALGGKREIVHIACLDTPESNHKFTTLGWFGRATTSALEIEYKLGTKICVAEQTPPRVDGDGHRIVYVQHNDGRDYANAVISEGFGLLRPANCRRGEHYRAATTGRRKTTRSSTSAACGAVAVPSPPSPRPTTPWPRPPAPAAVQVGHAARAAAADGSVANGTRVAPTVSRMSS